ACGGKKVSHNDRNQLTTNRHLQATAELPATHALAPDNEPKPALGLRQSLNTRVFDLARSHSVSLPLMLQQQSTKTTGMGTCVP
ncbi:hypothetical protein LTR28_004882, partial [Elasticomyces elasticus]